MKSVSDSGYINLATMRMAPQPQPGGDDGQALGELREILSKTRKTLGSIVTIAVSPNYGDPSTKLVNIALIASDALRMLEEAV